MQRKTLKADWVGIGIRIELRNYSTDNLPSVYELVRKEAGKQLKEDLTPERLRDWLDNYQIGFIFDGFDEIKPTDRDNFRDWLLEFVEFARGCPFIVRPA